MAETVEMGEWEESFVCALTDLKSMKKSYVTWENKQFISEGIP